MGFLSVPRTGLPGFSRQRKPSSKELQMLTTGSPRGGRAQGRGAGILGIYYKGTENFRENFCAFFVVVFLRHLTRKYVTANSEKK